MSTDYQPIACSLHDEYEIAIMQKRPVTIAWRDGKGRYRKASVSAKDLKVKDREEYLLFETPEKELLEIRLDRITLYR